MDAENFFVPSFLEAIRENTEAGFRRIMGEPSKGIYTFEMLQPEFCEMLVSEVSHFFLFPFMHIIISVVYLYFMFSHQVLIA